MIYVLLSWLARPLLWACARRRTNTPSRILVIQAAKIGDTVCSSPIFRELRVRYPEAHIAVLCNPAVAPLLKNNPRLNDVTPVAPATWRGLGGKLRLASRLRGGRYDAVLCCNGGATWPVVTLWAGIPTRIGIVPNFGGSSQRLANRLWTTGVQHQGKQLVVETYFEMLRRLGANPQDARKEVFAAAGAGMRVAPWIRPCPRRIGLAVSAANKLKELDTDKLAAVVQGLLATNAACNVILLGTTADAARAADLLAKLPAGIRHSVIDTCGRIDLADLPALLVALDAFVGVDSGLTYMADALDVPLVSVAGPCNMAETRPVGLHARIIQRSMPCLPCAHIFHAPTSCKVGTSACIRDVSADEIVAAVNANTKGTGT